MLRSGFEPESLARKAEMIGRATLPEHKFHPKESEFQELKKLFPRFVLVKSSVKRKIEERLFSRKVQIALPYPFLPLPLLLPLSSLPSLPLLF